MWVLLRKGSLQRKTSPSAIVPSKRSAISLTTSCIDVLWMGSASNIDTCRGTAS